MCNMLGTELPKQIERCEKLLEIYKELGASGGFGKAVILVALERAKKAQANGDIAEMILAYEELKELE